MTVAQCEELGEQLDYKLWRLGHRDPGILVEEECIFEVRPTSTRRSWRSNVCWVSYTVSYRGNATRRGVYADGGARDPSVLSCNKSSHIEAGGGYPKFKDPGSNSNG